MFRIFPFVLLHLIGSSLAYFDTSAGTAGSQCGIHLCDPNSSCSVNGTCICDTAPYDSGNGYIKCFSSTEIGTFIVSDPILSTYDRQKASVPIPCRYELTRFTSQFLDNSGIPAGVCGLEVRPFNRKDKGKFYLHGYDTAVRVTFNNGTLFRMSVRKFGIAENGTYYYQINATEGVFSVDGAFEDDDIVFHDSVTGINIVECTIDKENNLAVINITHCGICIRFRPYDVVLRRNQTHIPGLAVAIDNINGPFFVNAASMPIALIPTGVTPITMADLPLQVSATADIVYRALVGAATIVQNDPDANTNCTAVGTALSAVPVDVLILAFQHCLWILQSPKFIRCYDATTNGDNIIGLFGECAGIFYGVTMCYSLVTKINATNCQDQDPNNANLNSFINMDICN